MAQAARKDRARGTMQGGNVAGGLGVDLEFFESILVPNVMLYGFLGLQPTPTGCRIEPRLPKAWPSLTITRIHLQGAVLAMSLLELVVDFLIMIIVLFFLLKDGHAIVTALHGPETVTQFSVGLEQPHFGPGQGLFDSAHAGIVDVADPAGLVDEAQQEGRIKRCEFTQGQAFGAEDLHETRQ